MSRLVKEGGMMSAKEMRRDGFIQACKTFGQETAACLLVGQLMCKFAANDKADPYDIAEERLLTRAENKWLGRRNG